MTERHEGERRPDQSMTLLTSMFERPLDPGYEAHAKARERRGLPGSTGTRTVLTVIMAVLIGLMFATSALALRQPDGSSEARERLIERIREHEAIADARSQEIRRMQEEITAIQSRNLGEGSGRVQELQRLKVVTGSQAVTGPGLVITMDDGGPEAAAACIPNGYSDGCHRVKAADLQKVTNHLWKAGAEAIAINGHRLTAQSSIRVAGQALTVNFRPLKRPYVISVIGDPDALTAEITDGKAGALLVAFKNLYGVTFDISAVDEVAVPGAVAGSLREAEVIRDDGTTETTSTVSENAP